MRRLLYLFACLLPLPLSAHTPGPVVFSELMWMGSTASTADEWVELYNRSTAEVDLDGWTITRLVADSDKPMVHLKGSIPPGGTFLIANFSPDDPHSRLAVQPQLVASSLSLPNTKLRLRLFDGDPEAGGNLVDIADDGVGAPLAGNSQTKGAMVRIAFDQDGSQPENWATAWESSGWDPGATELGTPGALSSAGALSGGGPGNREEAQSPGQSAPTPAENPVDPGVGAPAEPPEPLIPGPAEPVVLPPDPAEESPAPLEPEHELPAPSQVQPATWGDIKRDQTSE